MPRRIRMSGARGLCGALCIGWLCVMATPAGAQEKFQRRNYRVRINVVDKAHELVMRGSGPYQVLASDGKPLAQLPAEAHSFVQITPGQPGEYVYRLVLDDMDPHQVEQAVALAVAARDAYNQPVKVLRTTSPRAEKVRILVTVGAFPKRSEAEEFRKKMKIEAARAIFEDRQRASSGEVRLVKADGVILARDTRFLRLVPLNELADSIHLMRVKAGEWSLRSLNQSRHYRGEIELTLDEEGTLTAVNDLWVEYYLYAVVAGEIGEDAPVEALKAQAVAARSEAVAKIQRGILSSGFFDFYDTALAQVYRGKGDEAKRVRQAVDATRGEILVWNGEAVDAVYSHSCGGYIASSRDLWDGKHEGYARRKLDRLYDNDAPQLSNHQETQDWLDKPFDGLCNPNQKGFPAYAKKYYRWSKSLSQRELSNMMNASYGTGDVREISVEERVGSGRVRSIKVVGERKSVVIDQELDIRRALDDIYSTFFTLANRKDAEGRLQSIEIQGAGYGHGVGLCQMGTWMMGQMGYNYRQILGHYYSDVKIRRLYR